jgi:mannose-6-phosphate isomerase
MSYPDSPLRFQPIFKRLIWGGRKLGSVLGKPIGTETDYAESWELADYGTDQSIVLDGEFKGRTLHDLLMQYPVQLLGNAYTDRQQFPLLVKFLDASHTLSVQVHPNDELAMTLVQDNGKTECWIIIESEPESVLYAGLQPGVTRQQFEDALQNDNCEALLHTFHPEPGDCVFIPAGTIHAIGAGIVLAEIQQMSNATFRVHDWGRTGPDGAPRQLHIEESLQAINFEAGPVTPQIPHFLEKTEGYTRELLVSCPYFKIERLSLLSRATIGQSDCCTILMSVEGKAVLNHENHSYDLIKGQTLLLPASAGPMQIETQDTAVLLSCTAS